MKRTILFAFLSLVLVAGCDKTENLDDFQSSDQVLGGDQVGDVEESPYWDWADAWPGMVSGNLERADSTVVIKGGYDKFCYNEDAMPLQSTGMYAGPTQTVQIVVPEGASDNLYCQIGMGYSLYPGQFRKRYDDVTTTFKMKPGVNRIMSYFGGFVYLYYNHEEGAIPAGDIEVDIKNAIQSKDFILGVTDERQWLADVYPNEVDEEAEAQELPFMELRSDRIILTLTREEVKYNNASPTKLLETFDKLIENQHEFAGMSYENQMPSRLYSDLQVPDSVQTPTNQGQYTWFYAFDYPMVITDQDGFKYSDPGTIQANSATAAVKNWYQPTYLFFEQFYEDWWMPDLKGYEGLFRTPLRYLAVYYHTLKEYETVITQNLLFTAGVMRINKGQTKTLIANGNILPSYTVLTRYTATNSSRTENMIDDNQRTSMFWQLLLQSDWGMYAHVNKRSRETGFVNNRLDFFDNYDFFAMCASEYLGKDLRPFFAFWRYPVTAVAGDYMAQFDPIVMDCVNDAGDSCYFYELPLDETKFAEIPFEQVKPALIKDNFPFGYKPQMYQYDVAENVTDVHYYKTWYNATLAKEKGVLNNSGDTTRMSKQLKGTGAWLWFDHNLTSGAEPCGTTNANTGPYKPDPEVALATDTINIVFYFNKEMEINALSHHMYHSFRTAVRMYNIEYLKLESNDAGEVDSVWVSTYPNEFVLENGNGTVNQRMKYYPFSETYNTTALKIRYQPNPGGQAGVKAWRTAWLQELYPCYYGHPNKIDEFKSTGVFGEVVNPDFLIEQAM